MLTKTQLKIMQIFTGQITELFSIRSVGKILKMNHSLVHRSITPLIKQYNLLSLNKQRFISLNFRENHDVLAYVEYLRRNDFFGKPRNRDLAMCLKEFVEKTKEESFVILVFGSAVDKKNPGDIDILIIVDDIKKTEYVERHLHNISRDYMLEKKLHIVAVCYKSVYEMLRNREQRNVMNEVLNRHILVHGSELFYRLLKRAYFSEIEL